MSMLGVLRGPRQVLFGAGQRRALGTVTAALGSRALVCTDARFGSTREFADLVRLLEDAGVHVTAFTDVLPDVPVHQVAQCAELAARVDPDVVVGMGGGSCLDLAKAVAVVLAHGGQASDYYGELRVPGPVVPVVALPTTAGTGSEVTPVAVLTDPERVSKVGISSPYIIPHTAVCDPELTLGCPPELTASAGADALSHVIEAFTAVRRPVTAELATERVFVGKNVLTDTYALAGDPSHRRQPAPRLVEPGRRGSTRGDDARGHRRRVRSRLRRHGRGARHPVPGRRGHPHPARGRGRRPAAVRDGVQPTRPHPGAGRHRGGDGCAGGRIV